MFGLDGALNIGWLQLGKHMLKTLLDGHAIEGHF
jgi:hypothetical protein